MLNSPAVTAARVAERHVFEKWPDFDAFESPPVVTDNGKTWHVNYELPAGTIGGTPELEIDKATLKVVSSLHSQ